MNPKLCCSGVALVILLLTGCNVKSDVEAEKADPVLVEYPVIYIERSVMTITADNNTQVARFSARDPFIFNPGANLFLKNNAFAETPSLNITEALFGVNETGEPLAFDIRDLSISDDGQQLLMAIRAPEIVGADEDEQPTWNIWLYQQDSKTLKRLITDDIVAEQGDDLMPAFLPDGRIVFASTRQKKSRAILLDEGKPQYTGLTERINVATLNLHVMQADGTNIQQLTFNLSHDFYPLVLQNGHILYSRWDAMGGNDRISLYQIRPDGTENQLVFGWHSQQLVTELAVNNLDYIKPQQMPNGDIFLMFASNDETRYQKQPLLINIQDYIDTNRTTVGEVSSQSAFSPFINENVFHFDFSENINRSGRLSHLFPLPDSSARYLLTWDLCRVVFEGNIKACGQLSAEELSSNGVVYASPFYELWLYDDKENTQQLVATTSTGKILTEAVVMQPNDFPREFIADKVIGNELSVELSNQQAAVIHIRSVYDVDGEDITKQTDNPEGIERLKDPTRTPADALPARFLRLIRGVPMPPDNVREVVGTDFGRSRNQLMREILGYTTIQPDGSVKIKVPANVPLALSILDSNGQRIGGRHRQWITLKAGETLECHGCHTRDSELPHGRLNAQLPSINLGATGGDPFLNTTELIVPVQGQTMAEADAMINGLAELSADIVYQDIWTNPALSSINPSIEMRYQNLQTPAPAGENCFTNWSAYCRIQINYKDHIQPLWLVERLVFDEVTGEQIANNTCVSCHNTQDIEGSVQIPAGQLDLTSTSSSDQPAHLTSYRELLFNDLEQEIVDGRLVDRMVEVIDENGNIVYQRDENGELILDENGNPIPELEPVVINAILSANGAKASQAFFNLFKQASHQTMLSTHELKLISEWLDIGAQYYNTPFYPQE